MAELAARSNAQSLKDEPAGPPRALTEVPDLSFQEVVAGDYRLLIESVRDYAIFLLDRDGFVRSWNPGAERIKGYKPAEIIGQHFSRFYPREDVEARKPQYELKVATAEGKYEEEGWRVRKD